MGIFSPLFTYVCSQETDECELANMCVFEWKPGKGEGPRVSGQKQLLLCARETSSRESERREKDQQGPDLYMGCALSVDSCGDEPDPVPVRGSLRRERAKSRGNMRLTKVGTSRIHLQVKSSESMFTCVPQCRKIKTLFVVKSMWGAGVS